MPETMTVAHLTALLHEHDEGILRSGSHSEGREFCALEFKHKVLGHPWSDTPDGPDYRPLNDARWSSDAARTAGLLPVMVALWDWPEWSEARQTQWWDEVVVETVKQIIAGLPGLSEELRDRCRAVTDRKGAREAAWAVNATYAAAYAYATAAYATGGNADTVLSTACHIWTLAAEHASCL